MPGDERQWRLACERSRARRGGRVARARASVNFFAARRARQPRDGYVTVCEPDSYGGDGYYAGDRYRDERAVSEYDVTYEYAGRQYTTRTRYHPGDRIRVRVDVRAE